jgi:hypothetical protein
VDRVETVWSCEPWYFGAGARSLFPTRVVYSSAELSTASIGRNGTESADEAAAEADRDRMGARARLKLCQEMAHVRLDRLL